MLTEAGSAKVFNIKTTPSVGAGFAASMLWVCAFHLPAHLEGPPVVDDELLRRDVRFLGDMLGGVIKELEGQEALDLIEEIRGLARARRTGDHAAEAALDAKIAALDERQASIVVRAFSVFFDLVNIAEDRQRVRVLRDRERTRDPQPLIESLAGGVTEFRAKGLAADDLQAALDRLAIELVFTAHPSEAKRRSIRAKLRRMRKRLAALDNTDLLPRESRGLEAEMHAELVVLWQSAFLRPSRPTVLDEVDRGLSVMPRIWKAVPEVYASLRQALADAYPGHRFRVPTFLTFGSWMGGDRDGNPFVTADVTAATLERLRRAAIDRHLEWCERLFDLLTISLDSAAGGRPLAERLEGLVTRHPQVARALETIDPRAVYRKWLSMIRLRLEASREITLAAADVPALAYGSGAEFVADVELLVDCLRQDHGLALDSPPQAWLDLARTFGLHMTRLDVRQDARAYADIMGAVLAAAGLVADADAYKSLDPNARARLLVDSLGTIGGVPGEGLPPLATDTLELFRVLHTASIRFGSECLGGAIVSLTQCPADVLCVLWLWRQAQRRAAVTGEPVADHDIAVVPLFEKINDLEHADETLGSMLDEPAYRDHVATRDNRQMVMVGYSDSTKDGGYLAACFGLQAAQERLHRVASARGVRLTFFHGRGGSLGRGGGPAARGILSLPPETLDGSLRLTEQGEVLAERYDDAEIARRHLDQVAWATLVASTTPPPPPPEDWPALAAGMAARSLVAYRDLVDQPGFIGYFSKTTPIDDIENLPIGSRPARRRGERTLDDLRAIPWVFAWTQSRCMIPAWYGLGAALSQVKYEDRRAWQQVCEMYRRWPFFQATIDNATLALAKADMVIAAHYSELDDDTDARKRIWQRIAAEYDRARQAILDIVGGKELLGGTPWFQRSIEARNPSVDPLNLIQVEFMRRRRAAMEADQTAGDTHRDLLRLCVQGVAAGMRTTG
jgi:phosphoenolpyruvate carboxylase